MYAALPHRLSVRQYFLCAGEATRRRWRILHRRILYVLGKQNVSLRPYAVSLRHAQAFPECGQ